MATDLNNFIKEIQMQIGASQTKALPPVEKWNPQHCGDIGMEIRADGSWWHDGARISRPPMIKLFSRILRKDDDGNTYLVTPYEKVIVKVIDAPFLAIRIDCIDKGENQKILVSTNVDDIVTIGANNPLRIVINPITREPRPYVLIRGRLEALILRAPFYELVELGTNKDGIYGVYSDGIFFEMDKI